ncbi:FAD:protein FMN transferase [Pseudomonas sp. N040]|uniref:FAD:protein FMN transferase n=1 Tax=Pseudomonas sp. N040 TaxID=2785325 RepID=UPI0035BE4B0D
MACARQPWCRVCTVLASLLLGGCGPALEELSGPTMGSTYSIKYVPAQASADRAGIQAGVLAILAEVDQQLSTYRADSLVSRFNALPSGSCMAMPEAVLSLVKAGEQLSHESEGAFDLTIEPLINLWGFGPQSRGEQVPSAEQIAAARTQMGHQYLQVDGRQLCKQRALQLDFNSIGAGYAVDRVAALLEQQGITSYLVDITGELRAHGRKPDGSFWQIGIEEPQPGQPVAARVLALDDLAVSTSGDYRNYFEQDGQRYSHSIDARSGAPISHRLASVSVVDPSAMRADGLSTVLLLLGPEQGFEFAQQRDIAALFISRTDKGFVSRGTRAFDSRFAKGAGR